MEYIKQKKPHQHVLPPRGEQRELLRPRLYGRSTTTCEQRPAKNATAHNSAAAVRRFHKRTKRIALFVFFSRGAMHVILDADVSLARCLCVNTLSKSPYGEIDQRRSETEHTIKGV